MILPRNLLRHGNAATLDRYVTSASRQRLPLDRPNAGRRVSRFREIPSTSRSYRAAAFCILVHPPICRQRAGAGDARPRYCARFTTLPVNNTLDSEGSIAGPDSWVEGCLISAPLDLAGRNVVVGVDVRQPLSLPREACLDVLRGRDRSGRGHLVRALLRHRRRVQRYGRERRRFCGRLLY